MKDTAAIITALVMIASGVALCIWGFCEDPRGEIHDTVLWYLAQALIYAGSIFGVKIYIDGKMRGGNNGTT